MGRLRLVKNLGIFGLIILASIFVVSNLSYEAKGASSNWWNTTFAKCKNVTLTNPGGSTLSDFPILINVTYDTDMDNNFSDLRIISEGCDMGGDLLDYEINSKTNGENAYVWVKIPSFVEGVNTISVYYDNSSEVSLVENPEDVWSNNYVMVHHFEESEAIIDAGGARTIKDSTSNDNDGTPTNFGAGVDKVDGKIGGGIEFDGVDDYIEANVKLVDAYPFTINTWGQQGDGGVMLSLVNKDVENIMYGLKHRAGVLCQIYARNTDNYYKLIGNVPDGWGQVIGAFNSNTNKELFLNGGVNSTTLTTSVTYPEFVNRWSIGRNGDSSAGQYYNGTLDEIRVSNVTRSDDWINMTYLSVDELNTYVALGTEEDYVAGEEDDCDYSGSGDYNVDLTNGNCTLTADVVGDGSNVNIKGPGYFNCDGHRLLNFSSLHFSNVDWRRNCRR